MKETAGRPNDKPLMYSEIPYEALAIGIVKQACVDYKRLIKKKKLTEHEEWMLGEVRSFFLGEIIKMYTTIDGQWLMKQIEKQVEEEKAKERAKKNPKRPKDARK